MPFPPKKADPKVEAMKKHLSGMPMPGAPEGEGGMPEPDADQMGGPSDFDEDNVSESGEIPPAMAKILQGIPNDVLQAELAKRSQVAEAAETELGEAGQGEEEGEGEEVPMPPKRGWGDPGDRAKY